MKKKLFIGVAAIALIVTVITLNATSKSEDESLLAQNIEAITQGEINPDCPNGCHDGGKGCYCYRYYENYYEHDWK